MTRVYTAERMAEEMGVTYRQLDYWVREGFISPSPVNDAEGRKTPGTGKTRIWVERDIDVAVMFAKLVSVGMTPNKIGDAADRIVRNGYALLPWGITVTTKAVAS